VVDGPVDIANRVQTDLKGILNRKFRMTGAEPLFPIGAAPGIDVLA
jgi:hypothetical protein